jgi:hypothetical protein
VTSNSSNWLSSTNLTLNELDFIIGLERDYPSTVSTVARTCAKLAPKEGIGGICVLCERFVNLPSKSQSYRLKCPKIQTCTEWRPRLESPNIHPIIH